MITIFLPLGTMLVRYLGATLTNRELTQLLQVSGRGTPNTKVFIFQYLSDHFKYGAPLREYHVSASCI